MATLTVTETEHTNSDSSCIAIKSNTSESTNTKQNTRVKNKNAVLRKSKSAQNGENLDNPKKSQMNEKPHEIKTQLSRPELDEGEADSAISMSFKDELPDDVNNLKLQPASEPSKQSRSDLPSHSSRILSGHQVVPKLPIAHISAVPTGNSTPQKGKFQHNRIQPVDKLPERNAFQTKCLAVSNNLEMSDVQTDGEQSLTTKLPPSYSTVASSLPPCSRGGMSDFVILHTVADTEHACAYMAHLLKDIEIEDLTVDLLSTINAGEPVMQSLKKIHGKYRYILSYITDNLESDRFYRFLQEILLTFGLKNANGKEDRVVPVYTKNDCCNILEISVIHGLQYFNFHPRNTFISDTYLKSVRNLVHEGREKFP